MPLDILASGKVIGYAFFQDVDLWERYPVFLLRFTAVAGLTIQHSLQAVHASVSVKAVFFL